MKKPLLLTIPLLAVNTIVMLSGGCFTDGQDYCAHYNRGKVIAWDNSNVNPQVVSAQGVHARAMSLQLAFDDTLYLCLVAAPRMRGNAAYAFTRGKNVREVTRIDSVRITSNHDYDAAHPAGTNLVNLFSNPLLNAGIKHIDSDSATYYLLHSPSAEGTHIFSISTYTADPLKNITIVSAPVKILL